MSKLNVSNRTLFIQDNLIILDNLNSDSVDLIYLDPPFNSNRNYSAPIGSKAAGAAFKDAWTLDDIDLAWIGQISENYPALSAVIDAIGIISGKGGKSYLVFMARRLLELYRILKPTGSIYLHCDPTMSHSLKLVMDCIFGKDKFRNEVVWSYQRWTGATKNFQKMHDIILFYSKSKDNQFNILTEPYSDKSKHKGQRFSQFIDDKIVQEYTSEKREKSMRDVWDISIINSQAKERTGYPTQKPIKLLERIIEASSNEGDIVLDPFCGCATTLVAAERLNRQWIGIDVSNTATGLITNRLKAEKNLLTKHAWKGIVTRTDFARRTDNGAIMVKLKEYKHTLYGAQKGDCAACHYHFPFRNLTMDHIIPQNKGGQNTQDNLQLLCGSCNSIKGNRDMLYLQVKLKESGIIT